MCGVSRHVSRKRSAVLFVWDAKTASPERKTFCAKLSGYGGYGECSGRPLGDLDF